MALLNYLTNGTYSVISRLTNRNEVSCQNIDFELVIYSDSSKTNILASKMFYIPGNVEFPELFSLNEMNDPPSSPVEEIIYFIGSTPTGDWESSIELGKCYAKYHDQKWAIYVLHGGMMPMYYAPYNKSYVYNANTGSLDETNLYDNRKFNQFFSTTALTDSNHVACAYLFLKSLPEFSDCTDV